MAFVALLTAVALTLAARSVCTLANEVAHEGAQKAAHESHQAAEAVVPKAQKPGWFATMAGRVFGPFLAKLHELQELDENTSMLKKKVADLAVENAELKKIAASRAEEHRAERIKSEAKAEGGVEHARTISSLEVFEPGLLSKPPKAVFDGALKAFHAGDYETSAKAFVQLADNEENDAFNTAQVNYLAAVSLYYVGNYKSAERFFEKSMKLAQARAPAGSGEVSHLGYVPRGMAWRALCLARVGDQAGARQAVHELIQKYPKSREARRLNRNENFR